MCRHIHILQTFRNYYILNAHQTYISVQCVKASKAKTYSIRYITNMMNDVVHLSKFVGFHGYV